MDYALGLPEPRCLRLYGRSTLCSSPLSYVEADDDSTTIAIKIKAATGGTLSLALGCPSTHSTVTGRCPTSSTPWTVRIHPTALRRTLVHSFVPRQHCASHRTRGGAQTATVAISCIP